MLKYLDISGLSYFYEKINSKFASIRVDTTNHWNSSLTFVPENGEIIVFSDYGEKEANGETINVPNFKIGDGHAYCVDLPFVNDDIRSALSAHINNQSIHVTQEEKAYWNNKLDCEVSGEKLVLAPFV